MTAFSAALESLAALPDHVVASLPVFVVVGLMLGCMVPSLAARWRSGR